MIPKMLKQLLAPVVREIIKEHEAQAREHTIEDVRRQVLESLEKVVDDFVGTPI